MNERERVKHCLAFGRGGAGPGPAPWQVDFTSEIGTKLMKAFGLKEDTRTVRGKNVFFFNELQDFFGSHLWYIRSEAVDSLREAGPGVWVDEWGVKWDRSVDKDIGVPVNTAFEGYDLSKLRIPDPDDRRGSSTSFPSSRRAGTGTGSSRSPAAFSRRRGRSWGWSVSWWISSKTPVSSTSTSTGSPISC
jgi:hypothetical protein